MLDIISEGKAVDSETLQTIHSRKTAALIQAACAAGAIFGGGSSGQIQLMRSYGHSLGMAFQIVDDLLNETATSIELGKAVGSDKERGKATYPAIFGVEKSQDLAQKYTKEASTSLAEMPGDTTVLKELAQFNLDRRV